MDSSIRENEAMVRLYAWKEFWRHGADAPDYSEPRRIRTSEGSVWHSHPRLDAGVERRFWPECGCSVEDSVPPLLIRVQLIQGPNGFWGQRDPRAAAVPHLKCHDCEGAVFVRWFRDGEVVGYSCNDRDCWPVAMSDD